MLNMMKVGIPERVAMAISGYRFHSAFGNYDIVAKSDLRDLAERVNRIGAPLATSVRGDFQGGMGGTN